MALEDNYPGVKEGKLSSLFFFFLGGGSFYYKSVGFCQYIEYKVIYVLQAKFNVIV